MQGPPAKDTIISPKKKHHTGHFKNAALNAGPNQSKEAGQVLWRLCEYVRTHVHVYMCAGNYSEQWLGTYPAWDEESEISLEIPDNWEES